MTSEKTNKNDTAKKDKSETGNTTDSKVDLVNIRAIRDAKIVLKRDAGQSRSALERWLRQ